MTFLTIENNNMNNYIVTFEYRVMVTAFTILAMFKIYLSTNIVFKDSFPPERKPNFTTTTKFGQPA